MRTQQLIRLGAIGALLLFATHARGEPYMMVREGAKCSACHINQTGGGKRTAFAHIHAHDIEHDLDLLPIPAGVKPFNGELNPWVSIGSDLRVRNTTTLQDTPVNGRVPNNKAFRDSVTTNSLAVNEFLLYGQIDLWPDVLTLYGDENFTSGANNREAFALIRGFLPWETYIKAGRMFPAYGLRVQDDQAYIRSKVGFTFQNPDTGGEIGIQPGPFFLAATVTNGSDPNGKDPQATFNGYGVFEDVPYVRNVVAGASFARQSRERNVSAVFAGSNFWRFTYLAEADYIDDRNVGKRPEPDRFATYLETHLLLLDWLDLRGTFEFVKVVHNQDQTRYTVGAEPFINRFIQPRIQYRINNGISSQPSQNADEIWLELHVFL